MLHPCVIGWVHDFPRSETEDLEKKLDRQLSKQILPKFMQVLVGTNKPTLFASGLI